MNSIHIDLLGTETRFYDTGNYRTRVLEVSNDRVPLLLLHGGGGHAEAFARNLNRLSAVARPIAPDFIWHGLSSKPKFWPNDPKARKNWLTQFTDQVLELMDHLRLDKAVIEGESLGGWIALDMAINHPERTKGIVLNTSWGIKLDPAKVKSVAGDLESLRQISVTALNNPTYESIRKRMEWLMPVGGVTEEIIHARQAIWSRPDTRQALTEYYEHLFSDRISEFLFDEAQIRKVGVPTQVLWTDHNPFEGVDAAERLHELIRGSRLAVMKNAGHWPQWEQPEVHDRIVMDFIRSL
jgi:2-hydroxy-6-oxonona-2,4-dienedioate hydrolase